MSFELNPAVKDVPNVKRGRKRKYPFDSMEVGQSFLVKIKKDENFSEISNRVRSSVSQYKRKSGKNFSARQVADGLEVWRIE